MEMDIIDQACRDLDAGKPVLIFDADDREGETDIVYASIRVTPDSIRTLRTAAGGLLCMTIPHAYWSLVDLPFLTDIFQGMAGQNPVLGGLAPTDIPYDSKSSFSITINARNTFTGITDADRSRTISDLSNLMQRSTEEDIDGDTASEWLGKSFRAPGHVQLLNTSKGLLAERRGHTELATALVQMAGLYPSATICEMMGGPNGTALPREMAAIYAHDNDLVFLDGSTLLEAWSSWSG